MRFPARVALALALLAVPHTVRADERPPDATTWGGLLSPGLKARIHSTAFSGRIEGRVQSADDSVVVLGTEDGVAVLPALTVVPVRGGVRVAVTLRY